MLEDQKPEGIPGRTGAQSGVRLETLTLQKLQLHRVPQVLPVQPGGLVGGKEPVQPGRAGGPHVRSRRRRFPANLDGRKCRTVPHQIESSQWAPSGFAAGSGSPSNILGGNGVRKGKCVPSPKPRASGSDGETLCSG